MALSDLNWRLKSWEDIKKNNYALNGFLNENKKNVIAFLEDFEAGINVPKGKKGRRTPGTLLKLRGTLVFLNKHFSKKNFFKITQKELHDLFSKMYNGKIKKDNGKVYSDVGDFIKNLKTFFDWGLRTNKTSLDICKDLSRSDFSRGKPSWVYLEHDKLKKLIDNARGDYRALLLFLYDSGVRPSEAYRLKVSDFSDDFKTLSIPDKRENGERVSKTFARTIKLKHCSELIKSFVEQNKLRSTDYIMLPKQSAFNKYLRTLTSRLYGRVQTKARGFTNQITLYDIRHMSAIYWLDKYPTHKDLMYRFGWLREDKILYYSEFLGRADKITDFDMITLEDKNKLQELQEKLTQQEKRISDIKQFSKESMHGLVDEITGFILEKINSEQIKNNKKPISKDVLIKAVKSYRTNRKMD